MITVVFDHKNKVNYKKYQLSKKYCMFYFNLLEIYQMSNDMSILHQHALIMIDIHSRAKFTTHRLNR